MTQKLALGKFPIFTTDIAKSDIKFQSTEEIINYFKTKIDENPMVAFISIFDHFNHTKKVGSVPPHIKNIQNIIFCFGPQVPDVDMVAVRPRSIGVTEFDSYFTINFSEAPGAMPNQAMLQWVSGLTQ